MLNLLPGKPHSPSGPIATTAEGSFSSAFAVPPNSNSTAKHPAAALHAELALSAGDAYLERGGA
jgi:hypothetical protein